MPSLSQFAEFASNHPILASGLVGSLLLLVFSELSRKAKALTDLSPVDVVRLVNGDGVVIDARSAEQFAKGHLAGARNIPAAELTDGSEKLKKLAE
ncbi:MAG: rhodanese-like domain-containing protein, partial [Pseudomonadota bacterium]